MEINGVGYRAALQGKDIQLSLGFSHDVVYKVPSGVTVTVPKPTEIVISGIDKQQVGQVAAEIQSIVGLSLIKVKVLSMQMNVSSVKKVKRNKDFVLWFHLRTLSSVVQDVFVVE